MRFRLRRRLPAEIEAIGADTPRRFSLVLAEPTQAEAARGVLLASLGRELTVDIAQRGSGGGTRLEVASTFSPESAAVMRPLNFLDRAGIKVTGLELHDLVTELGDDALAKVVTDWGTHGNIGPYRRRVERLAGLDLLDRCIAAAGEGGRAPDTAAWRFAVRCIAFNTADGEARTITEAASGSTDRAEWLVGAATDRVGLARLGGLEIRVPVDRLEAVLRLPGRAAELAGHLAALLPAPLPAGVAAALRDLAARGGDVAWVALGALHHADPTPELRATVDAALASDDPNLRAAGLSILARHWTADARPVWREFLASKSAPMRWTAESVIGIHGGEDDLADAAAHLAKLVRSRQGVPTSPPRGNEIIDLLVRHRDRPTARAALADLADRWARLSDDLRSWLEEHHPWLRPVSAAAEPARMDPLPAEELAFPPPTVERDGASLVLTFDEGAAHHPVRDRFAELLDRHPSVEMLDGDREWLAVRIDLPNPEGLVRELWQAASPSLEAD